MPLMLSPWRRNHQKAATNHETEAAVVELERPDPATTLDRLLVVRPTEGGLAFRLYGFPDAGSANDYVQQHLWLEAQQGVTAFWALHYQPRDIDGPSEAVVIIRDPHHIGVASIYSFTGMEAARDFVQQEFQNGIDPNLVLIYWAQTVDIENPPALIPEQTAARQYLATPALDRHVHAAPKEIRAEAAPRAQSARGAAGAATADAAEPASGPSRLSMIVEEIRSWPGWDGLVPRMTQALRLDDQVYEELDRDEYAMGRARLIVAIAVLAAGFGVITHGVIGAAWHVAFAAAAWAAFGGVLYGFGTSVAGGRKAPQTFNRLVRAVGLAASPGIFLMLGIIPVFGALVVIAVYVWIFLTTSRAISEPLELDNQSAVVTSAFGVLTLFAISQVLPLVLV